MFTYHIEMTDGRDIYWTGKFLSLEEIRFICHLRYGRIDFASVTIKSNIN